MGDHHVGDPFFAPPNPNPRPAGPPVPAPQLPAPTPEAASLPSVEDSLAAVPTVTPHPPQTEQTEPPRAVSRTELYSMKLGRLQELARARGLDASGKRPALIARIKNADDARRNSWDTEVTF